ncbi:hypothetical protein Ancab_022597 [Ancistrocladus abbreviatus]
MATISTPFSHYWLTYAPGFQLVGNHSCELCILQIRNPLGSAVNMGNNWLFFMDLDGQSPYFDPLISHGLGGQLFPHVTSFVDTSLYHSRNAFFPGTFALSEAFSRVSNFAGALIFWFSGALDSNSRSKLTESQGSGPRRYKSSWQVKHIRSNKQNLTGCRFSTRSKSKSFSPLFRGKISGFSIRYLFSKADGFSALSLAAALVPPLNNLNPGILAIPLENADVQMKGSLDQRLCEVEHRGCSGLSIPDLNRVLVGTGSKTMRIIKIRSLRVYAFGFYVHPYSVCEKLGTKYASVPVAELEKCHDFYRDLLREDIGMTIRLVVNCNGMKINTVKDAFEKSLRARLVKTNPNTDYRCLKAFGSCFAQDISLPSGTTIDFRRTADGQLITEIGGNQIGAVHSRDLCRAFFDMYIGEVPISEQSKEEIGKNVASIMRSC